MGLGVAVGVGVGILLPILVLLGALLLGQLSVSGADQVVLSVMTLLTLPGIMFIAGCVLVFFDGVRAYGLALLTASGVTLIASAGMCFAVLIAVGS